MKEDAAVSHKKGKRTPNQMQKAKDAKIKRLLKDGPIKKVDEIKDDVFNQPTVITVKKDRSVKIALDVRALNKAIDKDKYKVPNLENLMNMLADSVL